MKQWHERHLQPMAQLFYTLIVHSLGFTCLPLSPAQLRDIWDFDNECAAQLGAPLRTCSSVEEDNSGKGHSLGYIVCSANIFYYSFFTPIF